jgi:hypothetical protein
VFNNPSVGLLYSLRLTASLAAAYCIRQLSQRILRRGERCSHLQFNAKSFAVAVVAGSYHRFFSSLHRRASS